MTPKEKARRLRDNMYLKIPAVYDPTGLPHYPIAKEMALIAINEILFEHHHYGSNCSDERFRYWIEVKEEIEKL